MTPTIHWYDELDSTNDQLKRLLEENPQLPEETVAAARYQTAGRGRDGRNWLSEPDTNLMFSLLVHGCKPDESPATLTLAIGVGIARFLKERHKLHVSLKWPNDILVEGKKICGVLCEDATVPGESPALIVGVGLNVNMSVEQAARIDQPATSLAIETGQHYQPDKVLSQVLSELTETIQAWQQKGFTALREAWLSFCPYVGRSISFQQPGGIRQEGMFVGVGLQGQARLRQPDGEQVEMFAGDLIIRQDR